MVIRRATLRDKTEWLRMRLELWPSGSLEQVSEDMDRMLADPATPVFFAELAAG